MSRRQLSPEKRRQNFRTAMIMVSIALAIYFGYLIKARVLGL
ncbi:MAG: hypothetical protein RBR52_02880 [Thiomonas sp.]|nr:hypothetical protein [Thiomonas sp.]MDY0329423.1 hypothetical protein [Thiomonas sp.]